MSQREGPRVSDTVREDRVNVPARRQVTTRRRAVFVILGLVLILGGVFLPREWYDRLPRTTAPVAEPPIKGVTLLQFCLILDGMLLLAGGARRPAGSEAERREWAEPAEASAAEDWIPARHARLALLLITLTGLGLRLYRLDADLWVDEITPLFDYGGMSTFHVLTTYTSSNNHLLNTLLVNGAVALAGPLEWAIRLPAALFGTATIPVLYWVARSALPRLASLGVALLLAVSYHHAFFSQNARGYSAYLFLSLLTSGLLLRGLQTDRPTTWWLYVVGMVVNFAATLLALLVFAAHVMVGALLVLKLRLAGRPAAALGRRLLSVAAITGLLGVHLYATVLPQAYVFIRAEYVKKAVGFDFFSLDHVAEWVRGVSAGFGILGIFGMLPFLAVALLGFLDLARRHASLALMLVLPEALTAGGLLLGGLQFTPRFFLLGLPLAILSVLCAVDRLAQWVSRSSGIAAPKLAAVAVGALCAVSSVALVPYYTHPKQDFRGAIRYVEQRRAPGDIILPLYLADWGYWFYGPRFGLVRDRDYFPVRADAALDEVLGHHPNAKTWVVMTLPRTLRLEEPELFTRIQHGWVPVGRFPGTVGDGEVSVWVSKASPPGGAARDAGRSGR